MSEDKNVIKVSISQVIISVIIIVAVVAAIICIAFYKLSGITKEPEPIATNMIDETLINSNNKVVENKVEEVKASVEKIYLYEGYEFKPIVGVQNPSDMENTAETKERYETTYYNYEKGKYEGTSKGEFGEPTYDGVSVVSNVKRIAMTEEYNAIPRKYSRTTELPEELIDMADCSSVTIDSIDLDGDEKEEKIVCYTVNYSEGQMGDGEPEASSGIMLLDSNYKKIADLVALDDGFWAGIKEEGNKIFMSLEDVEYIDLDNDGEMEIIVQVPTYEGVRISIYKYSSGNVEGETNLKASVLP